MNQNIRTQNITKISRNGLVDRLTSAEEIILQEKLDGQRVVTIMHEGEIICKSKNGHELIVPECIAEAFDGLEGDWCFDGELMDDGYHIFDLCWTSDERVTDLPAIQRHKVLEVVLRRINHKKVMVVPIYTEPGKIYMAIKELRSRDGEGVVLRYNLSFPDSQQSTAWKFKFYKTVDAIVMATHIDGRRTVECGLFLDGDLISIGRCKVDFAIMDKLKCYKSVIEVRYLNVSAEGRLIQPVFIRVRNDKSTYSCSFDQLESVEPPGQYITSEITASPITEAQYRDVLLGDSEFPLWHDSKVRAMAEEGANALEQHKNATLTLTQGESNE